MAEKAQSLQEQIYSYGARYHQAMAQLFAALSGDEAAGETDETRCHARVAGEAYNGALVALLKHLKSLPETAEVRKEAEWTERTISLLSFEMRRL